MINLMPTEDKRQIRAARTNVLLIRYIIITAITFAFLLIAVAFTHKLLTGIQGSANGVLGQNHVQVQATDQATQQLSQLQSSLTSTKAILATNIDYTLVLTRIAALVPNGVVVGGLTLNSTSFGVPTTMSITAKTSGGTSAFQSQLQASPYFSGVTIQNLTTGGANPDYPISATLSVTINKAIAE